MVHGKASLVRHQGHSLFDGVPGSFRAGRYHSLLACSVPESLEPIAWDDDMVMAVAHRTLPVAGVQFHPESILTPAGGRILGNAMGLRTADRKIKNRAPMSPRGSEATVGDFCHGFETRTDALN